MAKFDFGTKDVGLVLDFDNGHNSGGWTIRVMQRKEDGEMTAWQLDKPWEDFRIKAHCWDKEYMVKYPEHKAEVTVGHGEYGFAPYFAKAWDVQAMAKVCTKIEKQMDAQYKQYGSVGSFAEFVLRVATALGIDTFYRKDAYGDYRAVDASSARYYIEAMHREYVEKLFPSESQAA